MGAVKGKRMLQAGPVKALGMMSGTSLDGVDAAMIETDGVTIQSFGPTHYRSYTPAERAILHSHLGRWQDDDLTAVLPVIEDAHIAALAGFDTPDIIGFHGQTLAHDPLGRGTHQAGRGQRIADALGVPVAWDFRTADVAAGGQGAPLAPYYHYALAKWMQADAPVVFLNLGGVGNLTWVDPRMADPNDDGALLAFDTGPANAPMNDLMQSRRDIPFDADGVLAATGNIDQRVVRDFMTHPYFAQLAPKSLDRDAFAGLANGVAALSDADAMASLSAAVVASVAQALTHCPMTPARVLVTGGGRRNGHLMAGLAAALDCAVAPVEDAGLDGDMLEAQAFAYLAVRTARGLPLSAPMTTGVPAPCSGGDIALPFKPAT